MKIKDPRPEGASWVSPYLTVKDCVKATEFYEKAFGFQKKNSMPGEDEVIQHVEMNYQDILVMFGREGGFGCTVKTPANSKAECPISLYFYCPDADQLFERAKKAGAQVIREPEDMFWGDRMAQVKDLDGYSWNFATHLES